MESRVRVHVGHGKTGSSYLQSCLALSKDVLSGHGIVYPISGHLRERAAKGFVTSGNILPREGSLAVTLDERGEEVAPQILLSSESLFRVLFQFTYREIRAALGEIPVDVLLFVRNPLSNAASSYQEFVKQGKTSLDFAGFLQSYRKPHQVQRFLQQCDEHGVNVKVRNFSECKKDLLAEFETWLGMPIGSICKPPFKRVNRSLSRSEMFFQRKLNDCLGSEKAGFLSRALCEQAPDIGSDPPWAPAAELKAFLAKMQPVTESINKALGFQLYTSETIDRYLETPDDDRIVFSNYQIEIIVRALSNKIA